MRKGLVVAVLASTFVIPLTAGPSNAGFTPPRLFSEALPSLPSPNVVGWIHDVLELEVSETGMVREMRPLQQSPGAGDLVEPAIARWRFEPATERGRDVTSHALVAAIYRPSAFYDAPTIGEPPVIVGAPTADVPFPISAPAPRFPPLAVADAVVIVEVAVSATGRVRHATVVASTPGFDQAAVAAASSWSFRPASRGGRNVETYAYLVFGFRRPVISAHSP
jgi:TonB family protein